MYVKLLWLKLNLKYYLYIKVNSVWEYKYQVYENKYL